VKPALAALFAALTTVLAAAPAPPGLPPTPAPLFAGAQAKPVVLLDAGHGGEDAGVKAGGLRESALTLELAKGVGALLTAQGVDVRFTRVGDQALSVSARVLAANTVPVRAFVSLHLNHSFNPEVQGPRVFTPRERTLNGTALRWEDASAGPAALSRDLGLALAAALGLKGPKPVQNLRLAQFRGLAVPGALVEVEMASNPEALHHRLSDAGKIDTLARALADGVLAYLVKHAS
jgi:N-acetylmuramoyl-L-alanine amidase